MPDSPPDSQPDTHAEHVAIVGAGFTGLAAAYELARAGRKVTLIESDDTVGGLAGSFDVGGVKLEKFYHHWFTNDRHVMNLIDELGLHDDVLLRESRTGMYYANNFFKLSNPMDLLKFSPLRFRDRIRLGLLALKSRRINDWKSLEGLTIEQWLTSMAGPEVYRVVWEPLLRGKFGEYASQISAVWMWNKLKLRGGSRGKGGAEMLAYFRGGFAALAERIAEEVRHRGGQVFTNAPATGLIVADGRVKAVQIDGGTVYADHVIMTPSLPIVSRLVREHVPADYLARLSRIDYLANVCLVLQLDRSLSDTYWLNVGDVDFPYVAIIEHTNFEPPETYGGRHIVYLSKYLPHTADLYLMSDEEVYEYSLPHIQRMFPDFKREWVQAWHTWRARYSQPVVTRHYSDVVPPYRMPVENLWLATMAQVYPEDRGTNYAIREGRKVARMLLGQIDPKTPPYEPVNL
ncbi:MAG: FAD-dependent oxidoreductase [Phycisphaera sp.]|nr:FAD-dependent oxidoreductase [Phycisphaera sp.]